jgi:hypothetical protein
LSSVGTWEAPVLSNDRIDCRGVLFLPIIDSSHRVSDDPP